MATATKWDRLIRFISSTNGQVRYGEPIVDANDDIDKLASAGVLRVRVLEGPSPLSAQPTGELDLVKELLGPLVPQDVPIIRCAGLNYKTHLEETGMPTPKNPTLFMKPGHAVADTCSPIPIPMLGQAMCDYEGELTVVIGRDAKDVSEAEAIDYVAGYVSSNDISCRDWQMEKDKAGEMQQWCFSKSFDKYAPLGPAIVSSRILGDGSGLRLRTYVNGELRQDSSTSDLYFSVRKLVSFFSQGQTLAAGSLIMTGTPGGVAIGMRTPSYLENGDEVVVDITGIGRVRNTMAFESGKTC